MSIRIGSSCALSLNMAMGKVVETRRFLDVPSQWYEIAKKCINEKKFLIITLCIDKNGKLAYMPSQEQWLNFVEGTVLQLKSIGANKYNCRIDIINEPKKFISKEKYAEFINLAYHQINKRFLVGAGCDELIYQDMYQYKASHSNYDVEVIHIQGACNNELNTINYTNFALNLAVSYKRSIDCNEANYFSIDTNSGYKGLLMNLKYAEKIGCANFPMVFMNLDKSAFSVNTDRWERLSFFVNGKQHSSYWNDFKGKIENKAPIPNIFIPIIIEEEDMKLKLLQKGSKGNQVKWLQKILLEDYQVPNPGGIDGVFGSQTEQQVKDYQEEKEIKIDGIVGVNTTMKLVNESSDPDRWDRNLTYYMAYK